MLQDWPIVAGCLGAALAPYLIERFAFKKRIGIFAFLFWLLSLQFLVIYVSTFAAPPLENNNWVFLGALVKAFGAMAFVTIGVIPFVALPLSILAAAAVLLIRFLSPAK